jgi:hypothetical protein
MENDPGLKKELVKKAKKKFEAKLQREVKEGLRDEKDSQKDMAKMRASYEHVSHYEDGEALISQDVADAYLFKDYREIFRLYKRDKEFSSHIIIKICLKLYSFLDQLSVVSRAVKLAVKTQKMKISRFYGSEVDLDDKEIISDRENLLKRSKILPEQQVFFMFILKISKKIEISIGEDKNKFIYFPVLPSTYYLEDKTKNSLMDSIDLERRREDFQSMFPQYFREMELNYDFSINNRFMYIISKNDTLYYQKYFCYIFGFAINTILLLTYELDANTELDDRRLTVSEYKNLVNLLSYILAGYAGIQFIIWALFRFWRQRDVNRLEFKRKHPTEDPYEYKNRFNIAVNKTFFGDTTAQNFLCHTTFALLGIFINPVFHTFHLLLLVNISSTAAYVVKASTAHFSQLVVTLIMAVFSIFSFSVLNADFFSNSFDGGAVNEIDVCKTLRSCTLYILNMGLRNGGGIADSAVLYNYENKKVYAKSLFDLLFFFLINVISLNIIFGIIIDTFSELRSDGKEHGKFVRP